LSLIRAKQEIPTETREKGVSVITTEEIRWAKCNIKSIALLPNVLANQKAVEAGVFEAIFVTSEGVVHDGTRSNIFTVKNERVYTPPKTDKILHGITRDIVLQCTQDLGYETLEDTVRMEDLFRANEVFLTGTTIEVLGVVAVNGKMIGAGVVGPVTERINERFRRLILS
jgi:D-alanine transaminase